MKYIVFGEDWASHPSSTQHLFFELAKEHEIHWINSVGMRKPRFKYQDLKRVWGKFKQLFSDKKSNVKFKTPLTMHVYKLPVLPWHDNALVRYYNKWVFSHCVQTSSSDEPIIYWLSVPTAQYMINKKQHDTLIYYCGDDFNALAGVDAKLVEPFEKTLKNDADLIYVISPLLMEKMPEHKTKLLTHGVSYDLFTSKCNKAQVINKLDGPIIGFYGSINEWLDIKLLTELVTQRPDYQLVLVGDIVVSTEQLLQFDNVTHISAVSHEQLVSFSAHWDISILPFVDNEQIRACDPLKLKEYLAVGAPIVATQFPAVERFTPEIFIAKTPIDFIKKLDEAVMLNTTQRQTLKLSQQNIAKQHSWQSKALAVQADILNLTNTVKLI